MTGHDISEPPLRRVNGFTETNIVVFVKVLIFRLFSYVKSFLMMFVHAYRLIVEQSSRSKHYVVRLLMFKGGFFHQTPRLGLTTVMSATFFSLLALPVAHPFGADQELALILTRSEAYAAEESMLSNNARAIESPSSDDVRNEVVTHTVAGGETLGSIAAEYLVSIEAIEYVNNLKSNGFIHPGDTLTIPPVNGLIHNVAAGDTVSTIASKYEVPAQAIVDFNHIDEPYVLHAGNELVIPNAKIPQPVVAPQPAVLASAQVAAPQSGLSIEPIGSSLPGTGGFIVPTAGMFTQYFSVYHPAVDIAGGCGTPVVAADSGTIYFAGWWAGGGGNSVMIDHGNGYITKYAHFSSFAKTSGTVQKGEVIGYQGETGRAYGCHLHFIVQQDGRFVNPMGVF